MNEKIKNTSIGEAIASQYDKIWKMMFDAIDNASDDLWKYFKNSWGYAWNSFHVVEVIFYHTLDDPKAIAWGERANINWEKDNEVIFVEKMTKISKELVREFIDEIRDSWQTKIKEKPNDYFLSKDDFGDFASNLERHIYSIRHAAHHIGELNKALRDFNNKRITWQ
ncbi:MAG: hypothetical protein ACXABO_02565 [Promethearchaeota archaeon]|jgi:hypothetical protein